MDTQHANPYDPLTGSASGNPLLASMEMMRQAWQGMSRSGLFQQMSGPDALTTEQLDKRIADLRAVEGWLKLNLSMLTSSIQALEVQRATLSTIKSYMGLGMGVAQGSESAAAAPSQPSALDIALGIKPSGQAKIRSTPGPDTPAGQSQAQSGQGGQTAGAESIAPFSEAAQAWWGVLQQQFQALAAATGASLQAAGGSETAVNANAKNKTAQTAQATENVSTTTRTATTRTAARTQNQAGAAIKGAAPAADKRPRKRGSSA